jgi:serine/threonine-protein kinase
MPTKSKVVIFGADVLGKWSLDYAKSYKVQIDYFADNNPKKWGKDFCGVEVCPPEQLRSLDNVIIILAVSYFPSMERVIFQLADYGFYCGVNVFPSINSYIGELAYEYTKKAYAVSKPIFRGFSKDKKFYVEDAEGNAFFLRTSDAYGYKNIEQEYKAISNYRSAGLSVLDVIKYGEFDFLSQEGEGSYLLMEWVNGNTLFDSFATLSNNKQYEFGIKAANILRSLHYAGMPNDLIIKRRSCREIIDRKLELNAKYSLELTDIEKTLINYVEENINLEEHAAKDSILLHGDFQVHNIMLNAEGKPVVIDFNRFRIGPIWDELSISVKGSAKTSQDFVKGLLHGYFGKNVSEDDWRLISFYVALNEINLLSSMHTAHFHSYDNRMKSAGKVLAMFDNMRSPIPAWYVN